MLIADQSAAQVESTVPDRSSDVASIEGIVTAFYESRSGPAGVDRDWVRLRALLRPDVSLLIRQRPPIRASGSAKPHGGVSRYLTVVRSQIAILL